MCPRPGGDGVRLRAFFLAQEAMNLYLGGLAQDLSRPSKYHSINKPKDLGSYWMRLRLYQEPGIPDKV